MKKRMFLWVLGMGCFFGITSLQAQDYNNADQLAQRLRTLAGNASATLESIAKTEGGKDIWMLTLGTGDLDNKPAMAVVGGVDGSHLLGVELATRFAEDIINNKSELLNNSTYYVFPNMSPDATAQYFASLKYQRSGNARQTDDDRDGNLNEDPLEDLNGDGMITMIRVEDATGDWVMHPADDRIMIKADKSKGEKGMYKMYSEGTDNDKDGAFNEDGEGGIHFRKNFTYQYPYFVPGSGEHSVSEKENRAMLDILYTKWNLYSVFTFGPGNNLSSPWKFNRGGASKRVVTSILNGDAKLNKSVSDAYNDGLKLKGAPASGQQDGDFLQWAYFHFGKLSLGTPGWWVPTVKGDSTMTANKDKNKEVNFLRWAAQENLNNYFVDWTTVDHPDFPGMKVEVGGVAPYKMTNPPFGLIDDVADQHNDFIAELSAMQADVRLLNLKSESVGKGMTRITVDVYNAGTLPTHTEMGGRSRWLRPIRVEVKLSSGQEVISGRRISTIRSLSGDGSQQFSWLVKGKGSVDIEAGAPHAGIDKATVKLK
jgi:Zinc carboxypeptidase